MKLKKSLCLTLVLLMLVNVLSLFNPTEVKADSDIVWTVMEVSGINNLSSSELNSICSSGSGQFVSDKSNLINTVDLAKNIGKGTTWYTQDKLYGLNVTSNGQTFTLNKLSYAGPESTLDLVLPDKIKFVACTEKETIKGENGNTYIYKFKCVELYLTSISTSFAGNQYDNYNTNAFLNLTVGKYVTTLDSNAFANNTKLKSVKFKGVIQALQQGVFKECINLTSLDLDNLLSAMIDIPNQCFYKCNSLSNVSIPNGIQNIGQQAFYQCDQIDYILLKDTIKTVGREAFAMCTNMRYVYITSTYQSNWDDIVDESERDKLITTKATMPIVAVEGSTSPVGSTIYNNCVLNVIGPIDIVDCTVTKNGSDVTTTKFVDNSKKYKTIGYSFNVNSKGTYVITAKDSLGQIITKTIKYNKTVKDKTAPTIKVGSKKNVSELYIKSSATVSFSDSQTYIASLVTNGKVKTLGDKYKKYSTKITKEGKYKYVVTDAMGNKKVCTVYYDKTAPKVKTLAQSSSYRELQVTDKVSGISSILLDGKKKSIKTFTSEDGYRINERGKHTLIVKDKAGNVKTYKFTI